MHWDEEVDKHVAAQPEGRLPGRHSLQLHEYIQSITSHDFNVLTTYYNNIIFDFDW